MVRNRNAFMLLFSLLTFVFFSCNKQHNSGHIASSPPTSKEVSSKAIKEVLMAQQQDWNKGDIPAFMNGYIKSEDLIFVGRSGINKGWDTTLNNYLKSYPDTATMGQLEFEVMALDSLSDELYRMVGRYTLIRAEDEPTGIFTLIWKRLNGQWKIISDHTSG